MTSHTQNNNNYITTKKLFAEDTVCRVDDSSILGIVTRTWTDLDSEHDSHEEGEEEDPTKGPIPQQHVVVSWMSGTGKPELIPEDHLRVLDRSLMYGDVVKDAKSDVQSGTVTDVRITVDLQHMLTRKVIRGVDTRKLRCLHDFEDGLTVVYQNWLGMVEEAYDNATVRFRNASICIPHYSEELHPVVEVDDESSFLPVRPYVGELVTGEPENYKNGRWIRGSWKRNETSGVVIGVTEESVAIRWETYNPILGTDPPPDPPESQISYEKFQELDKLESFAQHATYSIGDMVLFKDKSDAASCGIEVKDGADDLLNDQFDVGCMVITSIESRVDVLWQDTTVTQNVLSRELYPYLNTDDQDVWPMDFIVLKADDFVGANGPIEAGHLGMVQSVDAAGRTCKVKWFSDKDYNLMDNADELSFYEIAGHPDLHFRIAESVLVSNHNLGEKASSLTPTEPVEGEFLCGPLPATTKNWVAEIVDIHADGTISVRFASGIVARAPASRLIILDFSEEDSDDEYDEYDDASYESDKSWETMSDEESSAEGVAENDDDAGWETDDGEATKARRNIELIEVEEDGTKTEGMVPRPPHRRRKRKHQAASTTHDEAGTSILRQNEDSVLREEDCERSAVDPVKPADDDDELQGEEEPSAFQSSETLGFLMLEEAPKSHHYYSENVEPAVDYIKRVNKEYRIMRGSLPEGIMVRVFEDRSDLLRVLIAGPPATPYADALFLFDFHLPAEFPQVPPLAYFHSWTGGIGRANPNLYEDGKVCLSLLNTWHGRETESWSPKSTLLQIMISLQSLILVAEPYFNEAGFEKFVGTDEASINSPIYTEKAYILSLRSIATILKHPPDPFREEIENWYYGKAKLRNVVHRALEVIQTSERVPQTRVGFGETAGVVFGVSPGALKLLKNFTRTLEQLLLKPRNETDETDAN